MTPLRIPRCLRIYHSLILKFLLLGSQPSCFPTKNCSYSYKGKWLLLALPKHLILYQVFHGVAKEPFHLKVLHRYDFRSSDDLIKYHKGVTICHIDVYSIHTPLLKIFFAIFQVLHTWYARKNSNIHSPDVSFVIPYQCAN